MSDLFTLFLLVSLGSLVALIGGVLFLYIPSWSRLLATYSVPFAGGVLLTVALLSTLPESAELIGHTAFYVALLTFLIIYIFEKLFFDLHHHDEEGRHVSNHSAWFIMVGDTIHNLIDGVAIASAFLINPGLGLVTAISTFLHEVPHEIGDFGILLKAGWKKSQIINTNLVSALASLVGASVVFVYQPTDAILGTLLAISAGVFLYFGASDFLPHVGKNLPKNKLIIALLLGVGIMLISLALVPHGH